MISKLHLVESKSHKGRIWVEPGYFRFYLYQDKDGLWQVIDRDVDFAVGHTKHKTKRRCLNAFLKVCKEQSVFEKPWHG